MAKKRFTVMLDDKAFNKQIKRALAVNPQATVKGVRECILHLSRDSVKRAPVESGDLKNNCHADINGVTVFSLQRAVAAAVTPSEKAVGTVGYSLPYALRQHEELSYRHDRTDGHKRKDGSTVNMVSGGEAKFLEKPFIENKARYISRIAKIPEEVLK